MKKVNYVPKQFKKIILLVSLCLLLSLNSGVLIYFLCSIPLDGPLIVIIPMLILVLFFYVYMFVNLRKYTVTINCSKLNLSGFDLIGKKIISVSIEDIKYVGYSRQLHHRGHREIAYIETSHAFIYSFFTKDQFDNFKKHLQEYIKKDLIESKDTLERVDDAFETIERENVRDFIYIFIFIMLVITTYSIIFGFM